MAETASITNRVLDALVDAGLVTAEQLGSVREAAATTGKTAGDVLVERGLLTAEDLVGVLEDEMGVPSVDLSSYAPDEDALGLIPAHVVRERNMLPLFEIEGMLTVAIGDPLDIFELDSIAAEHGLEIEAVLADSASVRGAIVDTYGEAAAAPAPAQPVADEQAPAEAAAPAEVSEEPSTPAVAEHAATERALEGPPPAPVADAETMAAGDAEADELDIGDLFEVPVDEGETPVVAEVLSEAEVSAATEDQAAVSESIEQVVETETARGDSSVDLDVLAVADTGKVAILVTEILDDAVRRGASRVHILPYKSDFFLVYRIGGRLEKIASAPLSMQGALVEGFKGYARLGAVPASLPALGRLKSKVGDKDLVVTVSSVPTVAGQRMVISLTPDRATPRGLDELGMNEAEVRALHAMVERGRGILLVCAPVAGGRSSTYYSLLAHAASAGKTVYSVEAQIDYEIPAVAQVLVNPGASVGAASYFAAGIRQDTDIMAIDALQTVEEIHLAVEAAGKGKLVIATFSGGDIVSGVRRMLDMGAEPVSLAAALTLGVGQRLVRRNCPTCTQEARSPLAARIPGAPDGLVARAGTGCPNCRNTGFAGALGVFEVLPFTEPVRARIAEGASGADIASAAAAAGMRPMIASGLAHVEQGTVSPEELNRVLRFAE